MWALLQEMAQPSPDPAGQGPWQYANGESMQKDAQSALQWIVGAEERGCRTTAAALGEVAGEDPLFRDRVPEAAARQLAVVLAWLTECQLATLEGLKLVKRTSKSELARQEQICNKAVSQCKDLGVSPVGLRGTLCVRLAERLKS